MQKVQTKKQKQPAIKLNEVANNWSITNNTDADVVVMSAFTDDDQSVEQLYERSLTVLKTADGQSFIKAGAAAAVALDVTTYTVIVARADNLFPVKTALVKLDGDAPTAPLLTVTGEDAGRMKLAAKFQQMITAFPTSSLATDFATALKDLDPTKADTFFKATEEYKTLTIDDVVAVQTYYAVYPFVWACYGGSKNYGLHACDGVTNRPAGYISLTNECAVPLSGDKNDPGFTITYTNQDVSQPLYYANGQFVDDVNSESPAICLQGLFALKSDLTKNDSDNAIVAVLIGTINEESILGYDQEQDAGDDGQQTGSKSTLDILLHLDITKSWLELHGLILASVLGVAVLFKAVKMLMDAAFQFTPLTPEEIRIRIRMTAQQNLDRIKNLGIKDSARLRIPEDVAASLDSIKSRANDLLLQENKAKMLEIVNEQSGMFSGIGKYTNNNELQAIGDDIQAVSEKLWETSAVDLDASMKDLMSTIKDITDNLDVQANKVRSNFVGAEQEAMVTSKEAVDLLIEQVDNIEGIREDLATDTTPEQRQAIEFFEDF